MPNNSIKRGDVYYVRKFPTYGSEQQAARPAVVVSNDHCNINSEVVEVVYLTTQDKRSLPTHVEINSTGRKSLALCEQITSVSVERLGDFKCRLSLEEMVQIDQALCASLGIESQQKGPNFQHSEEDRLLALVCLKYLQNILGGEQTDEERKAVAHTIMALGKLSFNQDEKEVSNV